MINIKKILAVLIVIYLAGCATTVNLEKINEYYEANDEGKLETVLNNPEKLENPDDLVFVEKYYKELKKLRMEKEIADAINEKDQAVLERIISGEYDDFITESQKKESVTILKKIMSERLNGEIAEAVDKGECERLYDFAVTKKDLLDRKQLATVNKYLKTYTNDDALVRKYKNDKMNKAVRMVSKDVQNNIFVEPVNYIEQLAGELSKRATNKYLKAKIIHDWVCDNIAYDTDDLFNNLHLPQDYESVLKRKTAVCAGYADLFKKIAETAGFEVITINGYSKGLGYNWNLSDSRHGWNGIKIGSKWYLLDCTWDAGFVDRKTFVKKYSTSYLFINPRDNLYSHLPDQDEYQFYYPYVTKEQFLKEPKVSGSFFQYGLSLKGDSLEYNNILNNSPFEIQLNSKNRNMYLSSSLHSERGMDIDGGSFVKRKGNQYTVFYSPPDSNIYEGHVYARFSNEVNFSERINISEYENYYLPEIDKLIKEKKTTEKAKELFINSFVKIEENNRYYYLEDQFDLKRTNAVYNIFKTIGDSTGYSQSVLSFNLKSENQIDKKIDYPETYASYRTLLNTDLLEPVKRTLNTNEAVTFKIKSSDYNNFAVINNSVWHHFEKDNTGTYFLNYKVTGSEDRILIYGSKGKKSRYNAILEYLVD